MRLALAQVNPTIGDVPGNAEILAHALDRSRDAGADLVVFPELCVTGYPPKDLLLHEGFLADAADAVRRLGESRTRGLTAVFGLPRAIDASRGHAGGIANALAVYADGREVGVYDKRLLPSYDVFDESRYFVPGERPGFVDVRGVRVGLSICEDLWKGEDVGFSWRYAGAADPLVDLAAGGARLIVNPSASPFVLGKGRRHRELLARHAAGHRAFVAAVNQVGGNDELVFDGHACVFAPDGTLIAAAPGFAEHLLVADLPLGDRLAPAWQAVPDPLLDRDPEEVLLRALVLGTADYCRKVGFTSAILGLSGGIDSAVTAVIAALALGPRRVLGLTMPGPYSSEHARRDAEALASNLGLRLGTVPIGPPMDGFRRVLDDLFVSQGMPRLGQTLPDLAEENLQSRLRGTALMSASNRSGAIVLTTGNKSELAVGYCTLYGDMNGGLAVLSDVSKHWVYRLARWINANHARLGVPAAPPGTGAGPGAAAEVLRVPPIPERSITKPPSAELRPDQTDQDSLPPYDVLDEIIERYVERREHPARIARETGFDRALVARVVRMIDGAEYKRYQAAMGLKVTSVAFGRGRRVPIAQRWRPGV